ncbi:hypothetical protein ABZ282_26570 [Amycolatopsis tolypomycina]
MQERPGRMAAGAVVEGARDHVDLVRKDHGAAYAALLARHMVLPPHREGGQA